MMASSDEFKCQAVGAIDFGTSYSGFAYSFPTSPREIYRKRWPTGSVTLISEKTPTCILFDGKKNFVAFGFDAENTFADLCDRKENDKWYFFRGYKMELHDKMVVERDKPVRDVKGKEMPLLKIISETIKFLKQDMFNDIKLRDNNLKDTNVLYVLTVPAIWTDSAKAFMREAAEQAGIPKKQLLICLEPEAAAIYCMTVQSQSQRPLSPSEVDRLKPGNRYILIDAGGGTADVIAHEVDTTGALIEVSPATGGNWGGTTVDNEFLALMGQVYGKEVFEEFKKKCSKDYNDLLREFEFLKRDIKPQTLANTSVKLRLPFSLTDKVPKSLKSVTVEGGRLIFCRELFLRFFKKSEENIASLAKGLLQKTKGSNVTLVLVGGYAESPLLQDFIKKSFSSNTVIVPNQPGLAVLKGAVIFGHDPSVIAKRSCRYTYGIKANKIFEDKVHKTSTKYKDESGVFRARGCFDIHCAVGTIVKKDEFQAEKSYVPEEKMQPTLNCQLYACPRPNPVYTADDGCFKVGELEVDISNLTGSRSVLVALCFGDTEIKLKATKKETEEILTASINY